MIGKGESFFTDILDYLKDNKPLPFKSYESTNYLHESLFSKETSYVEPIMWTTEDSVVSSESLPIEIAKGCSYNCKFCNFEKQKSIKVDTIALKDSLIRNYELYGTTIYNFCDDCFNDTRPKVEEVCNAILSLPFKIEWVSYSRVDIACKFPHTLDLMIESGSKGLFWGLETFNHKIAKSIGKGTDPALVKEMFKNAKEKYKNACIMMGSFIIGLPGETEQSINETFNWVTESNLIDLVYCPVLSMRPYSEKLDKAVIDYADFTRNPQKYGFHRLNFYPDYDWAHDTMDRTRAFKLRQNIRTKLKLANISNSYITSVFQYPHLRELGLNYNEIYYAIKNHRWGGAEHLKLKEKEKTFEDLYFSKLKQTLTNNNKLKLDKP